MREERRLLVNRRDAERTSDAGCVMSDDAAIHRERAGVGSHGTRHDLDERRFACAIFADEGVDFAGEQFEGDALQRAYTLERFRDRLRQQNWARQMDAPLAVAESGGTKRPDCDSTRFRFPRTSERLYDLFVCRNPAYRRTSGLFYMDFSRKLKMKPSSKKWTKSNRISAVLFASCLLFVGAGALSSQEEVQYASGTQHEPPAPAPSSPPPAQSAPPPAQSTPPATPPPASSAPSGSPQTPAAGSTQAPAAAPSVNDEFPDGPGRDIFLSICSNCHTPENVIGQNLSADGWGETLNKMIQLGAPGSDEQFSAIYQYLTTNFGPVPDKIDVNKATSMNFRNWLSLSKKAADAIVAYRKQNGDFKSLDDLKKVPGVEPTQLDSQKARFVF